MLNTYMYSILPESNTCDTLRIQKEYRRYGQEVYIGTMIRKSQLNYVEIKWISFLCGGESKSIKNTVPQNRVNSKSQ